MHKLSCRDPLYAGRVFSFLTSAALALVALGCANAPAWAQSAERKADPAIRPEFREPVTLASKDGVLEVRLTARQGQATLDTVMTPVQKFLLFGYELIRGTASDGKSSGDNLYPAPTLQVFPGEKLIIHFENGLTGLTCCCTSLRECPTPTATTSPGTCRKERTGITATFMGSLRRRSIQVSSACLPSVGPTATCRSLRTTTFPFGTWRFSIISSLTVPVVWPNSTIRHGRSGSTP